MNDPLLILLLDDQPRTHDVLTGVATLTQPEAPEYQARLQAVFRLGWLRTPEEMRDYYLALRALAEHDAGSLSALGVVPELLIFDYALTSAAATGPDEASRGDTFPLPRLRQAMSDACIAPEPGRPLPPLVTTAGADRFGCFAGGLLCLALEDHVTAGVPTTQHASKEETGFFEWFLEEPLQRLFDHKTRGQPTWSRLLGFGLPALRRRFPGLLRSGRLRLSLTDLTALAAARDRPLADVLAAGLGIRTRYGARRLGVEALFFDRVYPTPEAEPLTPADVRAEVAAWAEDLAREILQGKATLDELAEARRHADTYFLAFQSSDCYDRYDLSDLVARAERTPSQEKRLSVLADQFGVPVDALLGARNETPFPGKARMKHLVSEVGDRPVIARWAALLMAVQGARHLPGGPLGDLSQVLTPDEISENEVRWSHLVKRHGEVRAREILTNYGLRKVGTDLEGDTLHHVYTAPKLVLSDLVRMLDPLPVTVLTFEHKRVVDGVRMPDATYLTNALKHLDSQVKTAGWGNLGLSLTDVIEHRPDDGRSHGVRPGEGPILRAYADEIGFDEPDWPRWLREAP